MINGLDITVFDNVFDKEQQIYMYNTARNFPYYLSNDDLVNSPGWEKKLSSTVNESMMADFRFFEFIKEHPLLDLVKDRTIGSMYINLGIPSDPHRIHNDMTESGYVTLLYYMNPFWFTDWGGETIFLDANGEIAYTSEFKPGRVILFDSSILHAARIQTHESNAYRFTFVIKYNKKD